MEIKKVTIIGLGAVGVLFGQIMSEKMPKGDLRIVADAERIARYRRDNVYCNGEPCSFTYISAEEKGDPADLLIFAIKFGGLTDAIKEAQNQVGPNTIVLSLINGISSEGIIADAYGAEKVLYSVAQGMDAVKVGNRLTYQNTGMICFGGMEHSPETEEKVAAVARFFDKTGVPYQIDTDMRKRLWGKLMLNVGVNQVCAVFGCDYGGILREGYERDTMIAAMREVFVLSEIEQVGLTEADFDYWVHVLDKLDPAGKPSMQQDLEAKRHTELELFAGTILRLAEKHGIEAPVNRMLYDKTKEIESGF